MTEEIRPAGDTRFDQSRSGDMLECEQDIQGDCVGAWIEDCTNEKRNK